MVQAPSGMPAILHSVALGALGAGLAGGLVACSSSSGGHAGAPASSSDAGVDASMWIDATVLDDAPGADDEAGDAGAETAVPTQALLRFANWSPDAPAADFCIAPHGTTAFQGPMLSSRAAQLDAGSGALPFPSVTAYLLVEPGPYDARLVAPGATDCNAKITADATGLPVLPAGGVGTIALVGATNPQHGEPALAMVGFLDDLSNVPPSLFNLRDINAAPDLPEVDLGMIVAGVFQRIQPNIAGVAFGMASHQLTNPPDPNGTPDLHGYVPQGPVVNATFAAAATVPTLLDGSAGSLVAAAPGITIEHGAIVTFVVVGSTSQADAGPRIAQLLECIDNGAAPGLAGTCQVVSQ